MCLSRVSSVGSLGRRRPRFGYKVVGKVGDLPKRYVTWDYAKKSGEEHYPLGIWEKDKSVGEIEATDENKYPVGFHFATNKKEVKWYVTMNPLSCCGMQLVGIKCRFRKVVAVGEDTFGKVIVAREVFNMGEI
jgi:hypothetical protein